MLSEDESYLTIRGIIFDQIDQRSCKLSWVFPAVFISPSADSLAMHDHLKAVLAHMAKYLSLCQKVALGTRDSTHPSHDVSEAFWRTLICNLNMQCRVAPLHRTAQRHYPNFVLAKCQEGGPFDAAMTRAGAGSVFCVTKRGYMVMVPTKAKRGDIICAFLRAHTIFVIRRKEESRGGEDWQGPELYRLIGECYIHGMTHEEIWELKDFENRVVDTTLG